MTPRRRIVRVLSALAVVLLAVAGYWRWHASPAPPAPTPETSGSARHGPAELVAEGTQTRSPETLPAAERIAVDEGLADPAARAVPEDAFQVLVLDADGTPAADVPIELEMALTGFDETDTLAKAISAADGIASFAGDEVAGLRQRMERSPVPFSFRAFADLPSAVPIRAPIAGVPEMGKRVELLLPPMAAVTVEVRTDEGARRRDAAQAGLWWTPAIEAAANPEGAYERSTGHMLDTVDGIARFPRVGLGLALYLVAHAEGFESVSRRPVPGPERAGDDLRVVLQLGPARPQLSFRILGVDGEPLASTEVQLLIWEDPDHETALAGARRRATYARAETDAGGAVTILHDSGRTVDFERRLDVVLRTPHTDAQDDPAWSIASFWLARTLRSGVDHDLGVARLQPVPLLAEGRVLDAEGNPLKGARLYFTVAEETHGDRKWRALNDGVTYSDEDGRFSLRALREPRAMSVDIMKKGYVSVRERDLTIGNRGLVFQLPARGEPAPTGSLLLGVRCDEGVSAAQLELELRYETGGKTRHRLHGVSEVPIPIHELRPGRCAAVVLTAGFRAQLLRIEDLEIRVDEQTSDARLLPVDLRGLVRSFELRLVRQDGTPVRKKRVQLEVPELRLRDTRKSDDEGRITLVLPTSVGSVQITETGQQWVTATFGASDPVVLPLR